MKSASRRQVRTPVGNKTKRGAELEGTPKTPRPFEATPDKTTDGSSHEPEDRRMQLRSRRPLQWNNIPVKQIIVGDSDLSGENPFSPLQQQAHLKCTGESKTVSALSPICINAIHGNPVEQSGGRKIGIKKTTELSPAVLSPLITDSDRVTSRKRHGKALVRNTRENDGDVGSTDGGSCPSSPDLVSSGKQIFLWSNAAFNTQPNHSEAVSISKDAASSSSSSSASSSRQNAQSMERADSEAESKSSEEHVFSLGENLAERACNRRCPADSMQKGAMVPDVCVAVTDPAQRHSDSELTAAVENQSLECVTVRNTELSNVPLARKISFGDVKPLNAAGEGHMEFPPFSSPVKSRDGSMCSLAFASNSEEDDLKGGLEEIQQEIERLTERLAELHLQKRKREEEISRQMQGKGVEKEQLISKSVKENEKEDGNLEKNRQDKRSEAGAEARATGNTVANSRNTRQSRSAQPQKSYGVESQTREESPRAPARRRAQGPAASVSKLSEMRRSVSVSSSARRIERSTSDERTKALRRLSLSGAAGSESKSQQQQQGLKPIPSKSTPSRVVSSRYGRAITPDACRPSIVISTQQASSKKRDRPFGSAASSPLPQPSPSPSASVGCSPLKKAITTSRSGYPSRSGFSTPTKDRQLIKHTPPLSSSMQFLPSTLPSSLLKSQDRSRILQSPRCMSPLPRLDSPKSTAALYKCLESLLEDSKHFFNRLSPARQHRLPQLQEPAIAAATAATATTSSSNTASVCACECSPKQSLVGTEPPLPSINTCRLQEISPRDSGCVKRASDRQKKRFYFAMEECIPQALESS